MIACHCKKCGASDPAGFYGYQPGECKNCTRARVRANRDANVDYYRAFDRARGSDPTRKAQFATKQRRKRKTMGAVYGRAHAAVARAIRRGELDRPLLCQRCASSDRVGAHHDDHAKPLAVMWLCPICHAARHKELGRLRTMANLYGEQPEPF